MALLQISEPGESMAPHEHRLAVGIDLGTTNSLVATVRSGQTVVLNDELGRPLLPSVVHYGADGHVDVGFEAQARQSVDPRNTIVSVKRFMGRGWRDIAHIESMPYDFAGNDNAAEGMVKLRTVQGVKSPVEVSAEILGSLRARAEASLGGQLTGAVITVPAYFDDAQRQATKDAARLAGLNVLRLLNEPTAAAIAYGLDNGAEGIYAVYDLGGGTFDISILKLAKGIFQVLATGGDSALGGDDFDHRVFCWIIEAAKLSPVSPHDARLLQTRAREAKEYLTVHGEAPINARLSTGEFVDVKLTEITRTLVQKTLGPTRKALRDAGLSPDEVKGVVMVGGATRMPQIQKAVGEYFGREPLNNLDPDRVVALGAAIQANLLAGNRAAGDDWLLLDVIPLSLGIETMGGLTEKIIPRNSTIPVDADGLLSVTAREQTSGHEARIEVKPSYGLTDDEVAAMLKDGFSHTTDDAFRRALREAQVEAQRLIEAVQSALKADAHLLSMLERAHVDACVAKLQAVMMGDDRRAIDAAMDALGKGTAEFAARRMNQSVQRALSGKKIEELES